MKAVIFCDCRAFAAEARSVLRSVGRRPKIAVQWSIQTLPLSILSRAVSSERALLKSVDAHLIVIPAKCANPLLVTLRIWLERWASRRQVQDAAIGVLGESEPGGSFVDVGLQLRILVHRHGLNLIANVRSEPKPPVKVLVTFSVQVEERLPVSIPHLSYIGPNLPQKTPEAFTSTLMEVAV